MRRRIAIILGLLAGLTGCREEKNIGEYDASEIKPLRVVDKVGTMTDAASGQYMNREVAEGYVKPKINVVTGGEGYKNSEFQSGSVIGTIHRSPGFRGADADYIDKADVYWKLNWIRKRLQSGNLPSNLKDAVKKTRKLLETVVKDHNYTTADQAVSALEEGIEHLDAMNALKLGNVDTRLVPWGAGREAVTRYFEKQHAPHSDSHKYLQHSSGTMALDEADEALTRYRRVKRASLLVPNTKEAESLAISYAAKYAASPEDMMRRAWSKAIEKTNKLRDDLGLMKRAENNDRDDVSVPTIYGTTQEMPSKTDELETTTNDVVPIPSISGDTRRVDVPASTFKEPDNPFGKS